MIVKTISRTGVCCQAPPALRAVGMIGGDIPIRPAVVAADCDAVPSSLSAGDPRRQHVDLAATSCEPRHFVGGGAPRMQLHQHLSQLDLPEGRECNKRGCSKSVKTVTDLLWGQQRRERAGVHRGNHLRGMLNWPVHATPTHHPCPSSRLPCSSAPQR